MSCFISGAALPLEFSGRVLCGPLCSALPSLALVRGGWSQSVREAVCGRWQVQAGPQLRRGLRTAHPALPSGDQRHRRIHVATLRATPRATPRSAPRSAAPAPASGHWVAGHLGPPPPPWPGCKCGPMLALGLAGKPVGQGGPEPGSPGLCPCVCRNGRVCSGFMWEV